MAAFQVILLASALLMAAESQTHSCDENPFHNGCTIPFNIDIPFRNSFLPACKRHDICYKCGNNAMYAVLHGRYRCDQLFYRNMKAICKRRSLFRRFTCMVNARLYYTSVRTLGVGRMKSRERVPSFCSQPWVHACLQ
ncbi:uncharacterized protein LOC110452926 isoform X1 [Mizuhopecten yessoensis]|uniref:uncharacterized protein LOC110452926 isoform X1 n=1 Tax=Mizuhopecten yessoensis TaxID=6573 RepID=UPI000B45C049|nr:uncharacterized protein LOC110452926 isoform X1 [Mizuhopecten yessoensis]